MSPFVFFEYLVALGAGAGVIGLIVLFLFLLFLYIRGVLMQAEKN